MPGIVQFREKFFLVSIVVATALAAAATSALAQARLKPPPAKPTAEVALVRQDQSDCTNANVDAGNSAALVGGNVVLNRKSNGETEVTVAITATPNTKYHFFLKCVRQLGDVVTQEEGVGVATFDFATNSVGNVFAFDMYPEGAPSGNKFQSVQVKIP